MAQPETTAGRAWRELARADLEAAHALISENHPAAVAELGDTVFQARLADGYSGASLLADSVDSFPGYVATLEAFANSLGDKHLWMRRRLTRSTYSWAGLIAARRGASWVIASQTAEQGEPALEGARLLACDGRPVEEFAARSLGRFKAVWSIEAQRISASPLLLIDDGNPFLKRPTTCDFEKDGQVRTVTLRWREVAARTLSPMLGRAVPGGQAGFHAGPFAAGWWIGLERLSSDAEPVLETVKQHLEEIRAAPLVVVDVRGNGGGNSRYGIDLAEILLGEDAVNEGVVETTSSGCPALWRASRGNLASLREMLQRRGDSMNEDSRAHFEALEKKMAAALAEGHAFDEPVKPCPAAEAARPKKRKRPKSLLKGRLVLLTDHTCFSSCLLMIEQFRRLGALHVGQTTDAATRYMEVREELLPSGIAYFSTLQKVELGAPALLGPFVPDRVFDGDISDTAALQAWVPTLVKKR